MTSIVAKPTGTTPWGIADTVQVIAPGITFYSTPSHGGYWINDERRAAMPAEYRDLPTFAGGNWYEEDCDWAIVCLAFPDLFPADALAAAQSVYEYIKEKRHG